MFDYLIFFGLAILLILANTVRLRWIVSAPLLPLAAYFLWTVSDPQSPYVDFNMVYYPAAQMVFENPNLLYRSPLEEALIWNDLHFNGFANIPIVTLLFYPFGLFELSTSQWIFFLCNVAAAGAAVWMFLRAEKVSSWVQVAVVSLVALSGPLYYGIKIGNITTIVFLLLISGYLCLLSGKQFQSGTLLALAGILKVPLLLFGFYFLLRGKRSAFLGFALTLAITVAASLLLFGLDLHLLWYDNCIRPFSGKVVAAFNNQTAGSFAMRLLLETNPLNWQPQDIGGTAKIAKWILTVSLLGGTFAVLLRSTKSEDPTLQKLEFCAITALAILISPISWTHYYLLLLLPFWVLIAEIPASQRKTWAVVALAAILVSMPVKSAIAFFSSSSPVLNFVILRIATSHYFLGGVLLLAILLSFRRNLSS